MPTPEESVLRAAALVVESTPEAYGQRMGELIAGNIDASLRDWIVAESQRVNQMLGCLGVQPDAEFVLSVIGRTMRRYGEALTG